jgi:hypothetical protein
MAKTLFILNDPPYGTERGYNGHGGEIGVCATCMDARGISDAELTDPPTGARSRSSPTGPVGRPHAGVLAEGDRNAVADAKTILILGGGVGGQVVANELRRPLPHEHRVIVIDRNLRHAFAPSSCG